MDTERLRISTSESSSYSLHPFSETYWGQQGGQWLWSLGLTWAKAVAIQVHLLTGIPGTVDHLGVLQKVWGTELSSYMPERCWGHIQETPALGFSHHRLISGTSPIILPAGQCQAPPCDVEDCPLDPGQTAHGSLVPWAHSYSSQPREHGDCRALFPEVMGQHSAGRREEALLKAAVLTSNHLGGQSWELHFEFLASMESDQLA